MEERLRTAAKGLVAPGPNDAVWKEECAFSFVRAESAEGLFLNVQTRQAFSSLFVDLDYERTGNVLYMHMRWHREAPSENADKEKNQEDDDSAPTRLAIGVDGGFSPPDEIGGEGTLVKEYGFVLYPNLEDIIPFPSPPGGLKIPRELLEVADAIIATEDASVQTEIKAWDASAEPRPVSKFAENLPQLDNGVRISSDPTRWKCQESGMKENLWLNLSTGYIGSGRPNMYGTGGTGAALKHFEQTGRKYPLCVKLGTITPEGRAEIYSYDPSEDCLVNDPYLEKHLKHLGLDMKTLKKTEKTILEMEIDVNQNLTLAAVLEDNERLVSSYGPGRVGLFNLGNSCYCNSVFQMLLSLPPFRDRFLFGNDKFFEKERRKAFSHAPEEPQSDLNTQFIKLAAALSDPFNNGLEPNNDEEGVLAVPPKMLKDCLAKGHVDFSSREQQDAREYIQHVLDRIARMDRGRRSRDSADPGKYFSFLVEERLVDNQSQKVNYQETVSNLLMLSIPLSPDQMPMDMKKDGEEAPPEMPTVSFDACLESSLGAGAEEVVADYISPVTGIRGTATMRHSLGSFPKYLAIQLKRYVVGDDWMPKKLECKVPVPRELDLASWRGKGLQDHEDELPDAPEGVGPQPDPSMVEQLISMGIDENGCKRALLAVNNASVEAAITWAMEHQSDANFTAPFSENRGGDNDINPESVTMLASMGFSENAAKLALRECNGNLERAADWIFSHAAELDDLIKGHQGESSGKSNAQMIKEENDSNKGRYTLKGFISHIGKNTSGGHYVCHINQSESLPNEEKDEWIFFNDRKVAISKNPPFEHGFLYIFERN